jgi:hypothetical protein
MIYIDSIHIYPNTYTYIFGLDNITTYGQIKNRRDETLYSRLVLLTETKGGGRRRWRAPPLL